MSPKTAATAAPVPRTEERGIEVGIDDGYLTVRMPIKTQLSVSRGGKHIMVASTHGNIDTGLETEAGKPIYLQVNAWTEL